MQEAAKRRLDREMKSAAYNAGINDGTVAGWTVPHLHSHLIPRYVGDPRSPRWRAVDLSEQGGLLAVPMG